MIKESIFRAYDVRGIYPSEINEEVVLKISHALGDFFREGEVLVARDGRLSSFALYEKVKEGLFLNKKIKVTEIGLSTTPMFYFLSGKLKVNGGIMVTASHNPKNYGGLKVIKKGVDFISGKQILEITKKFNKK